MQKRNLSLLMDYYALTMANGYFENGLKDKIVYYDMFFRKVPDKGGYVILAGLGQVIDYMQNLSFSDEDIQFLREKQVFSEGFLDYLKNFRFSCDVWAIPEGTPVFPGEPLITLRGPIIEAVFVETMMLLNMNHQCLIATKASRIVRAAQKRAVMEFGSRRAHGADAAVYGARAAYIGGVGATANTLSDKKMGIPAVGTMAHSWIQLFSDEKDAFRAYAELYPDQCVLLIDTYDVLSSGIVNAIEIFNEVVVPKGFRPKGVRIDSGDIAYLSKCVRNILDEAGFDDCQIVASGGLDEYIIQDLLVQGAKIDSFGVGERMVTAKSDPVFGGVYKLVAVEEEGKIVPRIKISENIEKITTPGYKMPWRLYDRKTGKAIADVITLADEVIDDTKPYEIFDPQAIWKKKLIEDFRAEKLQVEIFSKGQLVYDLLTVEEIRDYCIEQKRTLWDEVKRFNNPHDYYVDYSKSLWQLRENLLMHYE